MAVDLGMVWRESAARRAVMGPRGPKRAADAGCIAMISSTLGSLRRKPRGTSCPADSVMVPSSPGDVALKASPGDVALKASPAEGTTRVLPPIIESMPSSPTVARVPLDTVPSS